MLGLKIPSSIFKQILSQAKLQAPIEACGILAGKNGTVEKCYEMINTDNSTDHFMMKTEEQFKVVKDIRSCGLNMLAIYHSHPVSSAKPSTEDIRLAITPDVGYVIVSLQNVGKPVIKAFLIKNGQPTETPVEII